ncbi:DUF2750 domain-containing protein [Catenovulum sp. 2E275]|uniref:DUF2750 domain-containing protein n=1 Tax=Catenovulum sp. 2E275 TaxID=2980497 RepID=UPI0021D37393|nr:DUF2750 domain-containing protein [Catenovulum sp. 2E275]MCU4675495.1 DUF2750 domain-containing protein [Catenovulum sp. 2E275]
MSQLESSIQIELGFYREVAAQRQIFTIADEQGIPTPKGAEDEQVMPFWSSEDKALSFINQNSGYQAFKPLAIEWDTFSDKWVAGIANDDLLVGLNWQQADAENCVTEIELLLKGVIECLKAQPIKSK